MYVITGGPCTDKTTLLKGLAQKGFLTLPESARQIIAKEQKNEHGILLWQDLKRFQYKIIGKQIENERLLKNGVCFLDRGIVDCLSYMEKGEIILSNKIYSLIKSVNYDKVFLLDQLGVYQNDSERKEDKFEAKKIQGHIEYAYKFLGYEIVKVPNMGIKKRLDFVGDILKYGVKKG